MRARRKTLFGRILRLSLKGLGGVLLLCLLALCAALLWLRTPQAAAFLANEAAAALKSLGLELRLGEVSGPLPGHLRVTDIALDDAEGPLLRARALGADLRLSALLWGRLDIRSVELEAPELIRLPKLGQSPPDEPDTGSISLPPIAVTLGKLGVYEGKIHSAALLPETPGQTPPVLDFSASASALLSGSALSAALQGSLLCAQGQGLRLDLEFDSSLIPSVPSPGGASFAVSGDRLRLALKFEEKENGLAALLTGRTDLPAFSAGLNGSGPLKDWRGELNFTAGSRLPASKDQADSENPTGSEKQAQPPAAADGLLFSLLSSLTLSYGHGYLWGDPTPNPAAYPAADLSLEGEVRPGAEMPAAILPLFGAGARFKLGLSSGAGRLSARAEAQSPLLHAALTRAEFVPAPPGAAPAQELSAARLEADLSVALSDIAPLAAGAALSGPLEAEIKASGALDAPRLELSVKSPALVTAAGALRGLELDLDGGLERRGGAMALQGDVSLAVADSPGGALKLDSGWQAELPGDQDAEPLSAALTGLRLRGAGLTLDAGLSAALAPGGAFPALEGALSLHVADWKELAALSGLDLNGEAAGLDLSLARAGAGQSARLKLNLPAFSLGASGEGGSGLSLRAVTASAALTDIFGSPGIEARLESGRGEAAFLRWNKGAASVKGGAGRGAFDLSLRQESGRGANPAPKPGKGGGKDGKRAGAKGRADPAERLSLRGAYDLSAPELRLEAFALREPRAGAGVRLGKPLRVRLADGFEAAGLELAFEPGGTLKADAAFSPESMKLKLRLSALPFSFFKLFTPAALPEGEIKASADFSRVAGAAPRGAFSLQTRLSATSSASGLGRSGPAAQGASAHAKKAGAGAAAKSAAPESGPGQPPASSRAPFILSLSGGLDPNPGPAVAPGSGVRALPGVVWLRGSGVFDSAARRDADKAGRLGFQLPLRLAENGLPAPDAAAPLAAAVRWNGPVENLWQIAPLPDSYLSGGARLEAILTGSMNAPKHSLTAYLAGGRFEDLASGLLINGINLEARDRGAGGLRALLAAKDGRSGGLALEADLEGLNGGRQTLKLRGRLDDFRPLRRDDLDLSLSGVFGAEGPLNALALSADITVNHGELLLSSGLGGASTPTLDTVNKRKLQEQAAAGADSENSAAPAGPALDLHVAIPRYFFIRGLGLDSEWRGDLRVKGGSAAPSVTGALQPVRGSLDILSRTFTFSGGEISFGGGPVINPLLNLELTFAGPDLSAFIRAGGTVKKPQLSLDSRPPLPRDEVLAHVLFGKSASDLSRFEAIQLADAMRSLSGAGGSSLDLMTNARKKLGLDTLRLSGTRGEEKRGTSGQAGEGDLGAPVSGGENADAGLPALEAGKYINDSIYVGVEQGVDQDSSAVRVEVELFPSVTLQGKSSSEASEVGLGWKMDY